jgi:hypothetical protein
MFGYELTDKATKILRTLSVVLYLVSLVLPTGAGFGLLCLLMGWFELASSPLEGVAWLANPLLFLAWGSMAARMGNAARALSVVALVLGGSWIVHHRAITNEGGDPGNVPLGVGYWVWLISLVLAAISAFGVRDKVETET